jgi:hypothetical protein
MVAPESNPEPASTDLRMQKRFVLIPCLVWLLVGACATHPVHYATFGAVDQDASGIVEWHEFSTAYPKASPRSFMEADQNKDGEIAPQEWEIYIERFAP